MRSTIKIIKYQCYDILRNRWIIIYSLLLLILTDFLFRFGGDSPKVFISLMNAVLLLVPLLSGLFGIIFLYNSREFIELLLTQPLDRKQLYLGIYTGLTLPLMAGYLLGITLPFLLHAEWTVDKWGSLGILLVTGITLIGIFVAIAFTIAVIWEDRVKGFGINILLWLFFSVLFDGFVLLFLILLADYPLEKASILLTLLNPIDLARVLLLLRLEIAALMGYTGAIFQKFFGSALGALISGTALFFWWAIPFGWGIYRFSRKDF